LGLMDRIFKPNVEKLKVSRSIDGLIKTLQYPISSKIRSEAASALDELGWKPGTDSEWSYYLLAKQSWSELSRVSAPAVKVLLKQLQQPQSRQEAVTFLGEMGAVEAVEPLIATYYSVYNVLAKLGSQNIQNNFGDLEVILKALDKIGIKYVEPVIEKNIAAGFTAKSMYEKTQNPASILATPSSSDIQKMHAELIASMGELALNPLLRALSDSDSSIRRNAAYALGKMKNKKTVEPLIGIMNKDSDWNVRCNAATALGLIGDKRAVEPLLRVLEDKDEHLPRHAIEALGWIRDERAVETLTHIAEQERFFSGADMREALERIRVGRPCDVVRSWGELELLSSKNPVLAFTQTVDWWKEESSVDLFERNVLPHIKMLLKKKGITTAWINIKGSRWRSDMANNRKEDLIGEGCSLLKRGQVVKSCKSRYAGKPYAWYIEAAKEILEEPEIIET